MMDNANAGLDLDTVNNNTINNNNNGGSVNHNAAVTSSCVTQAESAESHLSCCTQAESTENPLSCCVSADADSAAAPESSAVSRNSRVTNGCSRTNSSRRSRSSGRSRSRRRHSQSRRRGSRHQSHLQKDSERNFPAALCSMISIVILCTALAEPRWIRIDNGHCTLLHSHALDYLGVFQFFYLGRMVRNDPNVDRSVKVLVEYRFGPDAEDSMINCVTETSVLIFKIIIALTFVAIVTSLLSFGLDLIGFRNRFCKLLRRNAISSICAVLVCVGILVFLYWATVDIQDLQAQLTDKAAPEPAVSFDVSFYLVTAAGAFSVLVVGCNCLQRRATEPDRPPARSILDQQFNPDTENLLALPPSALHAMLYPPPPPYTPA